MITETAAQPRSAIATWTFALVVVRRGEHFLLVHERKHGQLWYLPAGRVEPGESLLDAAVRETLEETGIAVELDGLLRVEHTPMPGGAARLRVIFTARPLGDTVPRTTPNEHSLGARWVSLEELDGLELRSEEVRDIFEVVARGGRAPYPLSVLAAEGAGWR